MKNIKVFFSNASQYTEFYADTSRTIVDVKPDGSSRVVFHDSVGGEVAFFLMYQISGYVVD